MTETPGQPRRQASNLQLRVISSVVLIAIVLALTFVGGWPFRLLLVLIAAAMFYEWVAMTRRAGGAALQVGSGALLGLVLLAILVGASAATVLCLLAAALMISGAAGLFLSQGLWTTSGLAYAGLSAVALAFLRDSDSAGLSALLFLFAIVWVTDILAYFVGRSIGGPKLAPAISPGKTWSGAIGGLIGGMIGGTVVAAALGSGNFAGLALVALLLSVLSQAGDLFESWVKRRSGVKDSGSIIPGHGGVMDRVDALVAAALALYVMGAVSGGLDHPAHGLF